MVLHLTHQVDLDIGIKAGIPFFGSPTMDDNRTYPVEGKGEADIVHFVLTLLADGNRTSPVVGVGVAD
jgi:hypothetical protein